MKFFLSLLPLLCAGFVNFQVPAPPPAEPEAPPAAPEPGILTRPTIVTQSFDVVSLKEHPGRVYTFMAALNGKPCRLLFDTGASHTTFSHTFIAEHFPEEPVTPISLGEGSNVAAAKKLTVRSLRVGESEFTAFAGIVLNISHLSEAIGEQVDGILGMNVMRTAPFILSCEKSAFQWVSAEERTHWREREMYGEANDQGTFTLNARLREQIVPMVIDSGANLSFVSEAYWSRKQNRPANLAMTDINSKPGAAPKAYSAGISEILMLGPAVMLREVAPIFFEEERLGIFGTDLLRRLDILIDAPINRIYAVEQKR